MAKKRKLSDGATSEDVQALLLRCTRRLRALTPDGEDLNHLDIIEAELVWQANIDAWLAANPERRAAFVWGSDRSH